MQIQCQGKVMTKNFRWCLYDARWYQCWQETADHALLTYPNYFQEGWVNVSPAAGIPLLMPTMLWAPLSQVQFFSEPKPKALPPIPFTSGLQIGSRVRWGTSLGEWAIVALDGDSAQIRQVSGWAQAVPFDAPVGELRLLGQPDQTIPTEMRTAA